MTGFAIAERRCSTSCRPILRLAPCGIALSAEGGHSRLAWRLHRHLDGARGCQPCRRYLTHHYPDGIFLHWCSAPSGRTE
jgi:hypothetical protein